MPHFSDADNLAYMRSQAAIINREAVELDYNPLYQALIPVSTEGHPFAPAVVFGSATKLGQARFISGNADDVPFANLDLKEKVQPVHTAAVGYSYGFEELGVAQAMGINLTADKAVAARRAYEEFVDVLAFNGNAEKSIAGFKNLGATDRQRAFNNTAANWTDADKFMKMVFEKLLLTGTNGNPTADTLLVSPTQFALLATSFVSSGASYLQLLKDTNPVTASTGKALTVRAVKGLETSGTGGAERVIMYRKDPSVLALHIPMPHRFLEPALAESGMRVNVAGVFRIAGIQVKRADDVLYLDHAAS